MNLKFYLIIAGILISFPNFAYAQKTKVKKSTNQTKKITNKKSPKISTIKTKTTEADWQKFVSEEGQFSVLFPVKPNRIQQDSSGSLGKVTKFVYVSSEDSENVCYAVLAQTAMPDWNYQDDSEYEILQLLQKYVFPSDILATKKDISTSGLPAIEWTTQSPSSFTPGWIQFGRAYRNMKTRRMYIITYSANGLDRYKKYSNNATKFFNSFKIF